MLKVNRAISIARASVLTSRRLFSNEDKLLTLPPQHSAWKTSNRSFLDFYKLTDKKAIEKERERLRDEMTRGYFKDMAELGKHGGKIAMANKILIPAAYAVKFPDIEAVYSDGRTIKLPIGSNRNAADADKSAVPKVTLMCLSFRANSHAMVNSWSGPFCEANKDSKDIQVYQVSFIDKWLLCLGPIKRMLLRILRKSADGEKDALQKQLVYSFGDHYYFRKELKILNLLTGYIFLLDKFGRVRWQGFGLGTEEEVTSLLSCTSILLDEN